MQREPAVYGLRARGMFGYVGSTSVNTMTRWWEHRSRARNGHPAPVYQWMREVGWEDVEAVVLERADGLSRADMEAAEVRWIDRLRAEGHVLANDKGVDGTAFSNGPSMRRRVSATKRGRPTWIKGKTGEAAGWTDERRAAQSERVKRAAAARRRSQ